MTGQRACIFIDGSNFYNRLKEFTSNLNNISLLKFNYSGFCNWLCDSYNTTGLYYYIGAVKETQDKRSKGYYLYKSQTKLFRELKDTHNFNIVIGELIMYPNGTYHEKGVDVRLAIDLIRRARNDEYDVAYLLSSDSDLAPAVLEVLAMGKQVVYVCTKFKRAISLSKISSKTRIITESDIMNFL